MKITEELVLDLVIARAIVVLLLSECVECDAREYGALVENAIMTADALLSEIAPDEKAKGADHDRR